jgi:hypothetical protein
LYIMVFKCTSMVAYVENRSKNVHFAENECKNKYIFGPICT